LSIETSQRELLKQQEAQTFNTAMKSILSQRTDAYKQDIDNLESQITLLLNNGNIIKVVSQELPFTNSNTTLRDHVCFQLSALYTATRQQHITQRQLDLTSNQSTAMEEGDTNNNNNVKSDAHIANLIRNVLKEELKHMLKPSPPSPKKQNSNLKESHPNKNPKNEFERGRDNTPRRNGNGNHVRRSKSDSSRQSKSNSSTNTNRVNYSHHRNPSNSNSSPRGRRNYTATDQQQDDRPHQRNNFRSKSPQSSRKNYYNNYNNRNSYNHQRNSSPPPPRYRKN
jgi:hypothetical protein